MKKNGLPALLALLCVMPFDSCTKENFCGEDKPDKALLKQMRFSDRTYTFFYNENRNVDSIRAEDKSTQYTCRVWYSGMRIDSVGLIDDGHPLATHTNITYEGKTLPAMNTTGMATSPALKSNMSFPTTATSLL